MTISATGSEDEGIERAKESRSTADGACGDGIETIIFTEVCGRQSASNELDEAKEEIREDIRDIEHEEATII